MIPLNPQDAERQGIEWCWLCNLPVTAGLHREMMRKSPHSIERPKRKSR